MPSDLKNLLERAAEQPSTEPDFAQLARVGRRRRYTQRAASALAVVAVIALTSTVVMPRLRPPAVAFDTSPRGGVGTWESVPAAPIEPRVDAVTAADDRRVVVFGGTASEDPRGDVPLYDGAVYDTKAHTWTAIKPLSMGGELAEDHWFPDHVELLDDGRLLVVFEPAAIVAFYDFGSQTWDKHGADIEGVDVEFAAWTGSQAILLGSTPDGAVGTLVYTDDLGWRAGREAPLSARLWTTTEWTGDRLLVWGGASATMSEGEQERVFDDGASYDPVTDTWEKLPASPLAARQSAESLWTGEEWIVMGGLGAQRMAPHDRAEASEQAVEATQDGGLFSGSGTASVEGQAELVGTQRVFVDGARYNPSTQKWSPVAQPPKGAREYLTLRGETFEAQGNKAWAVFNAETNTWEARAGLPNPYDFDATVYVGKHAIQVNTTRDTHMSSTNVPRRIGGQVYDSNAERWDPLAEAETSQRWGAAVTPVGDNRYFVWGGVSVTRDITGGYSGGEGVWNNHDDGAMLTLD